MTRAARGHGLLSSVAAISIADRIVACFQAANPNASQPVASISKSDTGASYRKASIFRIIPNMRVLSNIFNDLTLARARDRSASPQAHVIGAADLFARLNAVAMLGRMDFVDLQGASGRMYRFRRWPSSGHHPPIAGNYALLRVADRQIVALGTLDNLAEAGPDLTSPRNGLELFIRLNVSRVHRESEHADLWAALPGGRAAVA